jgi:hypothetical protein
MKIYHLVTLLGSQWTTSSDHKSSQVAQYTYDRYMKIVSNVFSFKNCHPKPRRDSISRPITSQAETIPLCYVPIMLCFFNCLRNLAKILAFFIQITAIYAETNYLNIFLENRQSFRRKLAKIAKMVIITLTPWLHEIGPSCSICPVWPP